MRNQRDNRDVALIHKKGMELSQMAWKWLDTIDDFIAFFHFVIYRGMVSPQQRRTVGQFDKH